MSHSLQAGVKANPLESLGVGQEEVDNATGHHAAGEAIQGPERAWPQVKTVPILTLLQQQLKLEHIPKYTATYLIVGQRNAR